MVRGKIYKNNLEIAVRRNYNKPQRSEISGTKFSTKY